LVWSVFTLSCGLSISFWTLFLFRMGVGAGEAGAQPALTSITADILPKSRSGFAFGVLYLGHPLGGSLGLLVGGYAAVEFGWRTTFLLAGIPGILLAIMVFMFMRDPRNSRHAEAGEIFEGSLWEAVKILFSKAAVRWVTLAQACSAFLAYATAAWVPVFFIRVHDMTTAEIGGYAALAVGVVGGIGTFGSAAFCDVLRPHVSRPESKVLIALSVLSVPALWATFAVSNSAVALIGMFVLTFSAYAWLAPSARLTQIASGPSHRGLAIAFATSTGVILSLCVGLPIIGVISDFLTTDFGSRALGYALLIALIPAMIIGIVSHLQVLKHLREE
jgi:predicted MFS family arabinose efflux permease